MCKPTVKSDLRLLDPKRVRLRTDSFQRLHLEVGFEERYGPVRAVRCLPLSQPGKFISIQDDEGEEIGIIPDAGDLDGDSRQALEKDLELYYLKAEVQAIKKVESRNGILTWELETSLGPKTVHLRDRQNIRPLPNGRIILTDIHGAKYEIPPIDTLDEKSRSWLEVET
jgi:uncharacterized protein DUF1854